MNYQLLYCENNEKYHKTSSDDKASIMWGRSRDVHWISLHVHPEFIRAERSWTQIHMLIQTLLFVSFITKTYLYNFDPLKPHVCIVTVGFTWVYIIFLISAKNIDCGYSLEPPRRGGSNEYSLSIFWAGIWTISDFFLSENFPFWL